MAEQNHRRRQRRPGRPAAGERPTEAPPAAEPVQPSERERSVSPPPPPRSSAAEPAAEPAAGPASRPPEKPAPRRPRDAGTDRGLRDLVGAGRSQLGVSGALRARDVDRPTESDLDEAERDLVIVRRRWKPEDQKT